MPVQLPPVRRKPDDEQRSPADTFLRVIQLGLAVPAGITVIALAWNIDWHRLLLIGESL